MRHQTGARAVIGIDGGGTKTRGVLATHDGVVVGETLGGGSNHQTVGIAAARQVFAEVVTPLFEKARGFGVQVGHVCFGLSGMDRPNDEAIFRKIIADLVPPHVSYTLVNDTFLILRAGAPEGWGIGVVSGTGSNCVMIGHDGTRDGVGGLGYEFGDEGSGTEIGIDALRAACRGEDGRGEATQLTARIKTFYGLERLDDLVDNVTPDAAEPLKFSEMAPIIFAAADSGDKVASRILDHAGRELALSVTTLGQRHFGLDERIPVVVGGSVFQRGTHGAMRDTFAAEVHAVLPNAFFVSLDTSPVLGALLLGFDAMAGLPARARAVLRLRLSDH